MELNLHTFNWMAILACIVIGQAFLTTWFVVIFANPWAKVYGVQTKQEHMNEIPGYTYAIGLVCTALLTMGIASLQAALSVTTAVEGAQLGLLLAVTIGLATALPGYAFLKRWKALALAMGSQMILLLLISVILAVWH